MVSLDDYRKLVEDRPEKLDEDEANYRDGEGGPNTHGKRKHTCGKCLHYFIRKIDGFAVCDIMRPYEDQSVEEDFVCDFFTKDGETFPLRPRVR